MVKRANKPMSFTVNSNTNIEWPVSWSCCLLMGSSGEKLSQAQTSFTSQEADFKCSAFVSISHLNTTCCHSVGSLWKRAVKKLHDCTSFIRWFERVGARINYHCFLIRLGCALFYTSTLAKNRFLWNNAFWEKSGAYWDNIGWLGKRVIWYVMRAIEVGAKWCDN